MASHLYIESACELHSLPSGINASEGLSVAAPWLTVVFSSVCAQVTVWPWITISQWMNYLLYIVHFEIWLNQLCAIQSPDRFRRCASFLQWLTGLVSSCEPFVVPRLLDDESRLLLFWNGTSQLLAKKAGDLSAVWALSPIRESV